MSTKVPVGSGGDFHLYLQAFNLDTPRENYPCSDDARCPVVEREDATYRPTVRLGIGIPVVDHFVVIRVRNLELQREAGSPVDQELGDPDWLRE